MNHNVPARLHRFIACLAIFSLVPFLFGARIGGVGSSIEGRITEGESSRGIAGVVVVALSDGVVPAGSAVSDGNGKYELEVPPGLYDLRAATNSLPFQGSFIRDFELLDGQKLSFSFALVPERDGLIEAGIDPDLIVDGDGDGLLDASERATAFDPKAADTDKDGIPDALAVWVGATARRGPLKTELAPFVVWPENGSSLPLLPAVPFEILFDPVPGATGYRLSVESSDGKYFREQDYSIAAGDVLLGESCALRWSPPPAWKPGKYTLRLQGSFGSLDNTVGLESGLALQLYGVEDLEALTLDEKGELYGTFIASTILITANAELLVPAGEQLHLVATQGIVFEEGGRVIGANGEETKPAAHLVISSGGEMLINGTLVSGRGWNGKDVRVFPSGAGTDSIAQAGHGSRGGNLSLSSWESINVGRNARVESGAGGTGGRAQAEADPGQNASAFGGSGGSGGRLLVHASSVFVADRPQKIVSGSGGMGGDAQARGGDGGKGIQSGLSSALPGVGGDAGDLWFSGFDLRKDGFIALWDPEFPIAGGMAGDPGQALPVSPQPGSTLRDMASPGRQHVVTGQLVGGGGWSRGGQGQPAHATGGEGLGPGNGGMAEATGGMGGPLRRLGMTYADSRLLFAFLPEAGLGGTAQATGGIPGQSVQRVHGAGGSAKAQGGPGGKGFSLPAGLVSRGGAGGFARALGINGIDGADRCPYRGQDGSSGGSALAIGGSGGESSGIGGRAGSAEAFGAGAGIGGMGNSGGQGGTGGDGRAQAGQVGRGHLELGPGGVANSAHGKQGHLGPRCPKK